MPARIKYLFVLFALILAISFGAAGCSGGGGTSPKESAPPPQEENKSGQLPDDSSKDEQKDQAGRSTNSERNQDNGMGVDEHQSETGDGTTDRGGDGLSNPNQGKDKDGDKTATETDQKSANSVSAFVNHMTLDEKIGQLVMVGVDGTQSGPQARTLIQDYHVGGIILYGKNIQTTSQTVKLLNQLKKINDDAGNPLPLFLSVDQEGGRVERLPNSIAELPSQGKVGKANDPELSRRIGQMLGMELSAFGFNMDFAPVLDVVRDPETSVIGDRSFGPDPNLVSELGVSEMKGIASQDVIPVVKHFPGYGEASTNAHTGLPVAKVGMKRLKSIDWIPYKKAIANGADAVMVTHILLPKLHTDYPASMSQKVITGMLRDELGFDGVVITDDMTMGAIKKNYDLDRAAVRAVKAGADIVLVAFNHDQQISVLHALKQAVKKGEITEKQLNQSVARILRLKRKFGLSNRSSNGVNIERLNGKIHSVLEEQFS